MDGSPTKYAPLSTPGKTTIGAPCEFATIGNWQKAVSPAANCTAQTNVEESRLSATANDGLPLPHAGETPASIIVSPLGPRTIDSADEGFTLKGRLTRAFTSTLWSTAPLVSLSRRRMEEPAANTQRPPRGSCAALALTGDDMSFCQINEQVLPRS